MTPIDQESDFGDGFDCITSGAMKWDSWEDDNLLKSNDILFVLKGGNFILKVPFFRKSV